MDETKDNNNNDIDIKISDYKDNIIDTDEVQIWSANRGSLNSKNVKNRDLNSLNDEHPLMRRQILGFVKKNNIELIISLNCETYYCN